MMNNSFLIKKKTSLRFTTIQKMYTIFSLKRDLKNGKDLVLGKSHWGKCAWEFMYNSVLSFDGEIENLRVFIHSFKYILPCKECREHFHVYLEENPLPKKKHSLFQWLMQLENKIAKDKYGSNYQFIDRFGDVYILEEETSREETSQEETSREKKTTGDCVNCHRDRVAPSMKEPSMVNMGVPANSEYSVPLGYARSI
jgi:hypothetical protein